MAMVSLKKLDDCIENILVYDDVYAQLRGMEKAYKLSKKIIHKNPEMSEDLADKLWDCKLTLADSFLLQFKYKKTLDSFPDIPTFLIDYNDFNSSEDLLDFLALSIRNEYYDENTHRYYGITGMEGMVLADMCSELSERAKNKLESFGFKSEVLRIYPGFSKSPRIDNRLYFHDFVMADIYNKKYIIDLSYSQFFVTSDNQLESLGVNNYYQPLPGIYMLQDKRRLYVARTILEKGWIEATDENIKAYLDGFSLSFRNGLYFEELGEMDFNTQYTAKDYESFLYTNDSQLRREYRPLLGTQLRPLKDPGFDYTSGTIIYETKNKKLVKAGEKVCLK